MTPTEIVEALEDYIPEMPPDDAFCHVGIVSQDECALCSRIKRAREALEQIRNGGK